MLQIELLELQAHVKDTSQGVALLFEGRDAAGKGGAIKRFMEHLNPRGARVVALMVPTSRETSQWYFQRHVAHLPSAGDLVLHARDTRARTDARALCRAEHSDAPRGDEGPDHDRTKVA